MPSLRAGVTQLAECLLPKQNVAGSNPVSRSTFPFVPSTTLCMRGRDLAPDLGLRDATKNEEGDLSYTRTEGMNVRAVLLR